MVTVEKVLMKVSEYNECEIRERKTDTRLRSSNPEALLKMLSREVLESEVVMFKAIDGIFVIIY